MMGILGGIIICTGVIIKNRTFQSLLFITGGALLELYSFSNHHLIYSLFSAVLVMAAFYTLLTPTKTGFKKIPRQNSDVV